MIIYEIYSHYVRETFLQVHESPKKVRQRRDTMKANLLERRLKMLKLNSMASARAT